MICYLGSDTIVDAPRISNRAIYKIKIIFLS